MSDSAAFWEIESPIGRLRLLGDGSVLTAIRFQADRLPAERQAIRDERPFREVARQLGAYFAGRLREFELPLAPVGTEFQKEVWSCLVKIPFGSTISYGDLARNVGRPTAARAVGAANGRNPIPIVIPCHRVIGATGRLTGFAGGLDLKRRLLELEGQASLF